MIKTSETMKIFPIWGHPKKYTKLWFSMVRLSRISNPMGADDKQMLTLIRQENLWDAVRCWRYVKFCMESGLSCGALLITADAMSTSNFPEQSVPCYVKISGRVACMYIYFYPCETEVQLIMVPIDGEDVVGTHPYFRDSRHPTWSQQVVYICTFQVVGLC